MRRASTAGARAGLIARLRGRQGEIEEAILARAHGVADPTEVGDPTYVAGLRTAVASGLDFALEGLGGLGRREQPVPLELLAQARHAARSGVPLDTVLRRYLAGHALLGDFILAAAEAEGLASAELQRAGRALAGIVDRIVVEVTEEHGRHERRRGDPAERRRAERVEALLAGEQPDTGELAYDFNANHLGTIAKGPGAPQALRELARALGRDLLLVPREDGEAWAWLGAKEGGGLEEIGRASLPAGVTLALGEPTTGLAGWRLTHRQARAALPIALRESRGVVRYAEVALLCSALGDELLRRSLTVLFLDPLREETLRETLRAYLAAGRNGASAAAALGVSRQTVHSRLRIAEERLGRPLERCGIEVELALRLAELGSPPGGPPRLTMSGSAPAGATH